MVEINNLTSEKIDFKKVESTILATLEYENKEISDISIAFINADKIREINKEYREIDESTDVLSFEKLQEILICPEEVKKNGKDFDEELIKVLIHGTLHLLGYDHEKDNGEMLQKQDHYFSLIKNK